jgi:hypothetical protein
LVATSARTAAPIAWGRSEVVVVVAAMALVACNVGVRWQTLAAARHVLDALSWC